MKKILLAGLLGLAACTPAQSGNDPAEQVFNQASQLLLEQYYGFSLEQLPSILEAGKANLKKACASLGSSCSAEIARPVIVAMIDQLDDPHTYFENPSQFTESQRARSGQGGSFPVLGFRSVYREKSNGRLITESLPGLVAESVGLSRGDLIIALNGKPLPIGDDASTVALRDLVRSGNEFSLTVRRAGQNREVRTTGKLATVPALPSLKKWAGVPSSVAILRIPDFTPPQVAELAHKFLNQAIKNGAKNLVLDLRGNPGGRATNCISLAGALLGRTGVIFASKTDKDQYLYTNGTVNGSGGGRASVPEVASFTGNLAVLVDKNSASCAEVTPALIQNAKRGTVVGESTYGILNTGNLIFPLMDGSGLTITTIRTLDLNGTAFPARVTPNFAQPEDLDALENSARDIMLEKAVRVVQGLDASQKPVAFEQSASLLQLQSQMQ